MAEEDSKRQYYLLKINQLGLDMQDRTITDTLGLFHAVVRVPKEPIIGFFRCDSRGPKGRSISPIKSRSACSFERVGTRDGAWAPSQYLIA